MLPYSFDDGQRAIVIKRHDLPAPWINYLSNGRLHAFVSQAGGGFAWWKSASHFRLTRYRMHHQPIDSPGFYLYIRRADGTVWSPAVRPANTALDSFSAMHRPGVSTFEGSLKGVGARQSLFVMPDYDILAWDISLVNNTADPVPIDLFAYVEFSHLNWRSEQCDGYYWRQGLKAWYDKKAQSIFHFFHYGNQQRLDQVPLTFFASSAPVESYNADRDAFIGPYRPESLPHDVEAGICANRDLPLGEACGALHNKITLQPGREVRLGYFLGVAADALRHYDGAYEAACRALVEVRKPGAVDARREMCEQWWSDYLETVSFSLDDKDVERQVNTWTPVNCVHAARFSRAVNQLAPGTRSIGFRDTCQDMLAIAQRKPMWAFDVLGVLLGAQFETGNVLHCFALPEENWHEDSELKSDDHLWLPILAHAIIAETGDISLLAQNVPYYSGNKNQPGKSATVWEHLLAGAQFTESHLGRYGLPLILGGDWNDIIKAWSPKRQGVTVFAAQQYVYALRLCIAMGTALKRNDDVAWLRDCLKRQEQALLEHAWDGGWWLRCFGDNGEPVGGHAQKHGKIFLNPQSWAVISGAGSPEQLRAGMQAAYENLACDYGIRILTPSFPTWPEQQDPLTGYGPGCSENGAIFCQTNAWAIIAETLLGNGERAYDYFRRILPHRALQKAGIDRYQSEPYAWVSSIIGPESKRYGWTNAAHITGTASWMDIAATQYILGIRPSIDGLIIDPCIPPHWRRFTACRKFRGTVCSIEVNNPDGVQKGIVSITVDGKTVETANLPCIPAALLAKSPEMKIMATMGK